MTRKPDPAAAAKAVQMLDLLAEYFCEEKHWIKGNFRDDDGNRCLLGAIYLIRARHNLYGDPTRYYLLEAIGWMRGFSLAAFNDRYCESIEKLRSVIDEARALAAADVEQAQQPKRLAA
jgi:hypothetical protein